MKHIDVAQTIGSPSAFTQEQGDLVYSEIVDSFNKNEKVSLDFSNVESMISPFLNNAIGKLYGLYTSEQIRSLLEMKDFPPEKNSTLNIVISNAKKYYADQAIYKKTVQDVIENA